MIPISDDNPTLRFPIVTVVILGLMAAAWLLVERAGFDPQTLAAVTCDWGMVPGELTHRARIGTGVPLGHGSFCLVDDDPRNVITPLTSMFLHGGWGHILGNGLFLWVFGNNVEDSMGRFRFVIFYLICGLAAAGAQIAINPSSPVPMIGASGAIAGVLGAYLVLYPRVRVNVLFIFIIIVRVIPLPAWTMLIWWIGLQLLSGLPQLSTMRPDVSSGVAVWAHIGGFAAGVALIKLFVNPALMSGRKDARRARPSARERWPFVR